MTLQNTMQTAPSLSPVSVCLLRFASLLSLLLCVACSESEPDARQLMPVTLGAYQDEVISQQKVFKVKIAAQDGDALPVNRYHNWVLTLSDPASGKSIYPAIISVAGGMAAHGHGLPTQPKVTRYLGEGRYLVEGMKFNMDGQWFVRFTIHADGRQDTAEVSFDVAY